jgi:Zn-dependent peptidase ImmA (M78 family)/transcriptional regulator with XRE-family HTH domain
MNPKEILAKSLKKEREKLGLSLKDAASKMGFPNYQTLGSIETGEREIKAWELAKLAKIYGRDIDYFLTGKESHEEPKILWRSPGDSSEKNQIRIKFLSFCRNYRHLQLVLNEKENSAQQPLYQIDKIQLLKGDAFQYIARMAKRISSDLYLGSRPACALSKILEEKAGIKIILMPLPQGLSAATTKGDFGMAILINSNDAPWRQNFDLAHEFFHVLTWDLFSPDEVYRETGPNKKNKIEQLADVFASSLLLPEEELRKEIDLRRRGKIIDYLSLTEVAREFDVSIEALLWRLVNIGIMRKEKVTKLLEERNILNKDKSSRIKKQNVPEVPISPKYVSLAIRAYHLGKISKARFAEYIDKEFSAISSFLKDMGYSEDKDYSVEYRIA